MGSHIVMFKSDATDADVDSAIQKICPGKVTNRYSSATKGFSVESDDKGIKALQDHSLLDDSKIELIEQDQQVKTQ